MNTPRRKTITCIDEQKTDKRFNNASIDHIRPLGVTGVCLQCDTGMLEPPKNVRIYQVTILLRWEYINMIRIHCCKNCLKNIIKSTDIASDWDSYIQSP